MYSIFDRSVEYKSHGNMLCTLCNKLFKNMEFLKLHQQTKHQDVLDKNGICLSDYCDTVHCEGENRVYEICNNQEADIKRIECVVFCIYIYNQ